MEKTRQKHRKWPWILALVLLAAGVIGWKIAKGFWPVFENNRKSLRSVAELREELDRSDSMKQIQVPEPAEFGYETESVEVQLDGSLIYNAPIRYRLCCAPAADGNRDLAEILGGVVLDRNEYESFTDQYKGFPARLEAWQDDAGGESRLELSLLCEPYEYTVCGVLRADGLTPELRTAREEEISAKLYGVLDRILEEEAKRVLPKNHENTSH